MKSKRSKACDISQAVKKEVWERDHHRCIFCGNAQAMPNAHVIPRSKGGLGVAKNIITACWQCHERMDHSTDRDKYVKWAKEYLKDRYGEFNESEVIYRK